MSAKEAPTPTEAPVAVTLPARTASLDLSVAETVIAPPLTSAFSAIWAMDWAPATMTATAPARPTLPPLPAMEHAMACAPRSPRYAPSIFWVVALVTRIAPLFEPVPVAVSVPPTVETALFLLTVTAMPSAMLLAFC